MSLTSSFQTRNVSNQANQSNQGQGQGRSSSAAAPGRSAGGNREAQETKSSPSSQSSHEQIAKRAYEIWVSHGRPHGQASHHWQQAEQELQRTGKAGRA
jgi:hypothetical protein